MPDGTSQFMPEIKTNIMGLREVDSLTIYVNDAEIKWGRASVFGSGKHASLCAHEIDIAEALAAPELSKYLKWTPAYVPPQDTFIHEPMPKGPNHFVIGVGDATAFLEYLEKQKHPPLNVLYKTIKDACDGNLETLSFEVTRELVPYDTGVPAVCY